MALGNRFKLTKLKDDSRELTNFSNFLRESRAVLHKRVTKEGKIVSNWSENKKVIPYNHPTNAYDTQQCNQRSN